MEPELAVQQRTERYWLLVFPLATLLLHLAVNLAGGYGLFRDEYYYIACSKRLAWGFVDQPPFCAAVLALSRWFLGESLLAIRLLPAVMSAVIVFLVGLIARELGGKRLAMAAAMTASFASPIYRGMGGFYSMNVFDIFFWGLSAYFVVRLINTGDRRYWYGLALALGLGVLNKISILWIGAGIGAGIVFSPERRWLLRKEPYVAGAIVVLCAVPYILWNAAHDFATLEFIRNATERKYAGVTPGSFIGDQVVLNNPASVFLWLGGLASLLFGALSRKYRSLGIAYAVAFAILLANGHSKGEYLSPAYTFLFAAGGVALENLMRPAVARRLRPAYLVFILDVGILLLPMALAVLPVETFISYEEMIGLVPRSVEGHELSKLPQFYADSFGWEEMARSVSQVYRSLPDSERAATVVYARNYGEAGALEYYRPKYPVPDIVCPHNNYWFWSKEVLKGKKYAAVIIFGGRKEDLLRVLGEVEEAAVHRVKYAMPYENNRTIVVGRKPKVTLEEIWEGEKSYI